MFGQPPSDRSAVRKVLRQELQRELPDVVYLDHLDSLVFRMELTALPFVMDLHNVYSTLVDRVALERRGLPRLYLRREAKLLQRMESLAAGLADALLTVSESDANHFVNLGGRVVRVVPNAVDCATYESLPTGRRPGPPLLLYVGAMSWAPNVTAARYLASELLPEIRHRFPDIRLRIVGRDPTPDVEALRGLSGVEVTGTVKSMLPHLAEAHALVVPLEAGGGTRLKILEAFAAGLPVVSTPVGCEGLRVEHGEHLLISGRERFAENIFTLLANDQLGAQVAEKARVLVREHYDWAAVSESACAAVANVAIANSRGCMSPKTGTTQFAGTVG
jgi:glycosyltransferase involved in cell wall biosynthesis